MRRGVRLSVATLALGMVATMPAVALTDETDGALDRTGTDQATDHVSDFVSDRSSDQIVDQIDDRSRDRAMDVRPVTDLPTDRRIDREVDRVTDRRIDREVDRVTDRCHPRVTDNRRCLDDHRPHDFNLRHLIWRLIKAHEWEKLIRLLHWLGWL